MRLNKDRQEELESKRIEFTKSELARMGFDIVTETPTSIQFKYKGELITFFPYSGWHTGKSIVDGRGWKKLLNQLTNPQ